jgi:hypothetical protein
MLDVALTEFLGRGVSLIVATVDADGAPFATRGWAVTPLSRHRARLLVAADDAPAFAPAGGTAARGTAIAVTIADVRTYRAVQLKGRSVDVEPATDEDRATVAAGVDRFATAVAQTDGTPRHLLDRLVPGAFVACTVEVDAVYDQTPGPGAGARVTDPS